MKTVVGKGTFFKILEVLQEMLLTIDFFLLHKCASIILKLWFRYVVWLDTLECLIVVPSTSLSLLIVVSLAYFFSNQDILIPTPTH